MRQSAITQNHPVHIDSQQELVDLMQSKINTPKKLETNTLRIGNWVVILSAQSFFQNLERIFQHRFWVELPASKTASV